MRLNCVVILALSLVATTVAEGQTGRVVGRIIDAQTQQPVAGVNVLLQGTRYGDVADSDGLYEIQRVPAGTYTMVFLHIAYDTLVVSPVTIQPGKVVVRDVLLRPAVYMLEGVTVEAAKESFRRDPTLVSVREMTPRDAKGMAGAAEDVFRALHALPGVLAQSEFDTRLYVRGGRPDQNLTLMDGISVYDPYRIFGLVTMFNPETVSDVRLLAGGFPAKYGDRLSAVLEVRNRTGSLDTPFSANLNTSITNANMVLEGRLPGTDRGSWIVSSRRTYYDLILSRFTDIGTFPNFWDVQAKLYYRFSDRDQIEVNWVNSRERTDLLTSKEDTGDDDGGGEHDIDSLRVLNSQRQEIAGLLYRRVFAPTLSSETRLSYYRNKSRTDFDATFTRGRFLFSALVDLLAEEYSVKHELVWTPAPRHKVEAGLRWSRLRARNTWRFYTDYPGVILTGVVRFTREAPTTYKAGAFIQDTFSPTPNLSVKGGLRFDHSTLVGTSVVSPRLSMRWSLGPLTELRAAWGIYYQYPSYETLQGEGFRYDLQRVKELGIRPEKALHYLAGLQRRLSDTWTLRVEGYYKALSDLLVPGRADTTWLVVKSRLEGNVRTTYESTEYFTWEPKNAAKGYAAGLEFYLAKKPRTGQRLSGWASYAFAVVRAKENGRAAIYLPYDQRHTVNVVGEYRLSRRFTVGFKWQYGSGFPYTDIEHTVEVVGDLNGNGRLDVYEDLNANGVLDPGEDRNGNGVLDVVNPDTGYPDERTAVVPDDRLNREYGARYPARHRLDVRLSHRRRFWGSSWLFYLDVINVYNRKNVQVYDYNSDFSEKKPIYGIPLVPTFGVSVRF
jgi:outer membrane cobalamin receptor